MRLHTWKVSIEYGTCNDLTMIVVRTWCKEKDDTMLYVDSNILGMN